MKEGTVDSDVISFSAWRLQQDSKFNTILRRILCLQMLYCCLRIWLHSNVVVMTKWLSSDTAYRAWPKMYTILCSRRGNYVLIFPSTLQYWMIMRFPNGRKRIINDLIKFCHWVGRSSLNDIFHSFASLWIGNAYTRNRMQAYHKKKMIHINIPNIRFAGVSVV